jgi:hypothetical protein
MQGGSGDDGVTETEPSGPAASDPEAEESGDDGEGPQAEDGGGGEAVAARAGGGPPAGSRDASPERRRAANVRALLEGGDGLAVTRAPLLAALRVSDADQVLRRPFRCPHPGAPAASQARRLAARGGKGGRVRREERARGGTGFRPPQAGGAAVPLRPRP